MGIYFYVQQTDWPSSGCPAWGGQPELLALAKALSRKVAVFARDAPVVEMGEGSEAPLVVTYHRDYYALGEHYNGTRGR